MDAAILRDDDGGGRHKLGELLRKTVTVLSQRRDARQQSLNMVFSVHVLCVFSGFDTDARLSFIVLRTDCVRAPHFAGSKRSHMLCPAEKGSKTLPPRTTT